MYLHLISFNVPFPANYGGVIDVFYKIKALNKIGVKIILHCFEYGREEASELDQLCEKVYYYKRKTGLLQQFSTLPYIVNSRKSKELLENLQKDNHPILFEGLHCCYYLKHPTLKNRQKIVRMHNIEWEYYLHLSLLEKNPIKKLFFSIESRRLMYFQENLSVANEILAISKGDQEKLGKHFENIHLVPAFHNGEKVDIKEGKGDYVLFHGDLSVKDNEESALLLIYAVFSEIEVPFIIAGLNPSKKLQQAVNKFPHIQLRANLPYLELQSLIQNAHINLLISFQSAGMKLKLLNAVFNGRFCLVNSPMVEQTDLEGQCIILEEPEEFQDKVIELMEKKFTKRAIQDREKIFQKQFSNVENAKCISQLLN